MKTTHPIDDILRLAAKGEVKKRGEQEVRVGTDGKVASGVLSLLTTSHRYLVRPDHDIELPAGTASVRDVEIDRVVQVPYRWTVKIPADGVATAVRNVQLDGQNADVALGRWVSDEIVRWWRKSGRSSGLPMEVAFGRHRKTIQAIVASRLAERGFAVSLFIALDAQPIPPREISTTRFPVRVSDYAGRELNLRVKLQLLSLEDAGPVDQKQPITDAEWETVIRSVCRDTIQNRVTLHQYYEDRDALEKALLSDLDAQLKRYGRICGWIVTETDPPDYGNHPYHDIEYEWQSLSGRAVRFKVRVEASVIQGKQNVYARSGQPDLDTWLRQNLELATNEQLLQKDFTQLKPSTHETFQRQLVSKLQARAEAIGVSVRALVAKPQLEEWRYLQPFTLTIDSRSYQTPDPGFPVEFDLSLTGAFSDLERVKHLVWPTDHLLERIEQIAVEAAAQAMRGIGPLDYLTNFESTEDDGGSGGRTQVRGILNERIVEALNRHLGLEVSEIQIRRNDTRLQRIINEIEGAKDKSFSMNAEPFDRPSSYATLPMEVSLRLSNVTPLNLITLAKKDITAAEIWDTVEGWLKDALDRQSMGLYLDAVDDSGIVAAPVAAILAEQTSRTYGVGLEVVRFRVKESAVRQLQLMEADLQFDELKQKLNVKKAAIRSKEAELLSDLQHESERRERDRARKDEVREEVHKQEVKAIRDAAFASPEDVRKVKESLEDDQKGTGRIDKKAGRSTRKEKSADAKPGDDAATTDAATTDDAY